MRPWIEKPDTQNWRLEPAGLAKPGETHMLTSTDPGLAHEDTPDRDLVLFWNRTELFSQSRPGPLAGYPDPFLTLPGSAETFRTSIGRDTPCLASRITTGSVTPRVLAEVAIDKDSDRRDRIITDNEDTLSNEESSHDDDTPGPTESKHDNDEPTAPSTINLG